jgi:hypothetical protein
MLALQQPLGDRLDGLFGGCSLAMMHTSGFFVFVQDAPNQGGKGCVVHIGERCHKKVDGLK